MADLDLKTATSGATTKSTPVDADRLNIFDSASSWAFKALTWSSIKATLKTYFDGLYTDDQTGAEIKTAYENEVNTNAFTDAEKTLLSNQSGTNTGDQDLSTYQVKPVEGAFVDGDKTKLDTIENNADVTDAVNVAGAGAVMNTGDETIAGIKTFSSFPIAPSLAPTTDYQLANKKYVDDSAVTGGAEYKTIYIDAGAMTPVTTSGAATGTNEYSTNGINFDYFAFDATTLEKTQFKLIMPENWDLGTIKAKMAWSSATGSSIGDTVEWGIKAGAISDGDAIDSALGTGVVISDTVIAADGANNQLTSATPALTVGGTPALSDTLVFETYRNVSGTDDMVEDAWLLGVWIQYKTLSTTPVTW